MFFGVTIVYTSAVFPPQLMTVGRRRDKKQSFHFRWWRKELRWRCSWNRWSHSQVSPYLCHSVQGVVLFSESLFSLSCDLREKSRLREEKKVVVVILTELFRLSLLVFLLSFIFFYWFQRYHCSSTFSVGPVVLWPGFTLVLLSFDSYIGIFSSSSPFVCITWLVTVPLLFKPSDIKSLCCYFLSLLHVFLHSITITSQFFFLVSVGGISLLIFVLVFFICFSKSTPRAFQCILDNLFHLLFFCDI